MCDGCLMPGLGSEITKLNVPISSRRPNNISKRSQDFGTTLQLIKDQIHSLHDSVNRLTSKQYCYHMTIFLVVATIFKAVTRLFVWE